MGKNLEAPLLTVLMPVYNAEKYVREAVDSILKQSFVDFEFLIIDDASTDQTVSLIKSYSDKRIKLIEKAENTGYTNSLNAGLRMAKGKFIGRMDSDDISLPSRFAIQLSYMESNPEVIVCGAFYEILGNQKTIHLPVRNAEIRVALLWGNCLAHPSVIIRKNALIQSSVYYDASKEPAEDYDLWVRLLPVGHIHNIPEVLLKYRIHYSSVSRKRSKQQEKESIQIKLQLLSYLNVSLEPREEQVLSKVFTRNSTLSVNEIKIFQAVKQKLLKSNNKGFFESEGFEKYLIDLEQKVLRGFAYRYERYSPQVLLGYLQLRMKCNMKLSRQEEFNLLMKSILYWKI